MIESTQYTCKCGEPSVVFDSWFMYYPCVDHKYLTPVEWSRWEPNCKEKEE